ncbi:hypothetical protein LDL76_07985 [Salegentibacter mishustinae]|mgnify:FL=1|jgi:hypothetical protein|uniref:hypothetical protein n=1 Tax=Salegentibacter mishustinae TaxID=270918 RepID=UPI001CE18072|nr:hypothetical protein [Salegentibacter mishustinae]UBZ08637.1 hypothetical protein LDL76_07985 [Salegentibacter mishustinae]|tara:strand:+ start:657 stop:836 length:180 start_codon:yes stop_codon:yes gene_type:complete
MNTKNLIKLEQYDIEKLSKGELIYVDHPEKGTCKADWDNVYINGIELTKEEKIKLLIHY